jgi:hypothetical protein
MTTSSLRVCGELFGLRAIRPISTYVEFHVKPFVPVHPVTSKKTAIYLRKTQISACVLGIYYCKQAVQMTWGANDSRNCCKQAITLIDTAGPGKGGFECNGDFATGIGGGNASHGFCRTLNPKSVSSPPCVRRQLRERLQPSVSGHRQTASPDRRELRRTIPAHSGEVLGLCSNPTGT